MVYSCQTLTYKIEGDKKELFPKEQILSAFFFLVNKANQYLNNNKAAACTYEMLGCIGLS